MAINQIAIMLSTAAQACSLEAVHQLDTTPTPSFPGAAKYQHSHAPWACGKMAGLLQQVCLSGQHGSSIGHGLARCWGQSCRLPCRSWQHSSSSMTSLL
jgi:hypothetical protein